MIGGLVLAELRHRPGRALFLLTGYAFGVAVVVVLLSVGEAMLSQARDRSLFGGGDLLVLPAGMSVEMLRGGGTTSLFLELEQARFLQRQILESPRAREGFGVVSASPILEGQPVEIAFEGRTARALASGEIPGRARAAGAAPRLLGGTWVDSDLDRRWADPTTTELLHEIDAFHLPYGSAVGDSTWAEWHYFNVRLDDDRWFYLTFMVAGRVGVAGEWGGRVLLSVRDPRDGHRQLVRDVPADGIVLDTLRADLRLDAGASVRVEEGAYHLLARVDGAEIDLRVDSSPHRYFPPAEMGGEAVVSGYVVPALAGRASGRVCLPVGSAARCADVVDAPAYHDHNWGVWRDVGWEWGAASDDEVSLLYGAVRSPELPDQGIVAYLVDEEGVRGLYRPASVGLHDLRPLPFGDRTLDVPRRLTLVDTRRGLEVEIDIEDYQVTDMERDRDRYFLQMSGAATVRESGSAPRRLRGFFETYVD